MAKVVAAYAPSYGLPGLLGLATIPLLSRSLGPAEFGVYGVCLSIHGLMLTFSADPTTNALRRLYAREAKRGEPDRFLRAVFGLSLTLAACVAVLAAALALLAALLAPIGAWLPRLLVVALMTAAYTVFQFLVISLYVRERVSLTASVQVIHTCMKSGALILGAILYGTALASFATYGIALACIVGVLGPATMRLPFPFVDRERWKQSLLYGAPLIGASVAWIALTGFDRLTLAALSGTRPAGFYAVAYLLSDFSVQSLGMLLWFASYPSMVRHWEHGQRSEARRTLLAATDMFVIFGTTVVTVLAVAGSQIVRLISGPAFVVPTAVPVLVGTGVILYRLASFETIGFEFALQSRRLAFTFLMAAGLCVPITVGAVAVDGLTGAAMSTTGSFALFWILVRRRGPSRALTDYPVRRLLLVFGQAAGVVVLCRLFVSAPVAVVIVLVVQPCLGLLALGRWRLLVRVVRPQHHLSVPPMPTETHGPPDL